MGDFFDPSDVSMWAVAGVGGRGYAAWRATGAESVRPQRIVSSRVYGLYFYFISFPVVSEDEPCTSHSVVVSLELSRL